MVYLIPSLEHSVFLPGLVTMLLQANIGLRSRLSIIKSLSESNQRFQMLFNSTFEGVLVHDQGRILDVNESLINMLGYSRAELIDKNILDLLPEERRKESEDKNETGGKQSSPYETKVITKDLRNIDIEVRAKDFLYDKTHVRLVTVQDISDRKQAEKERIVAMTLVENLRIRDDFISIASHELRTPISTLSLQLQLIERDLKKAGQLGENARLADFLNRQIERLAELVETMLDVS